MTQPKGFLLTAMEMYRLAGRLMDAKEDAAVSVFTTDDDVYVSVLCYVEESVPTPEDENVSVSKWYPALLIYQFCGSLSDPDADRPAEHKERWYLAVRESDGMDLEMMDDSYRFVSIDGELGGVQVVAELNAPDPLVYGGWVVYRVDPNHQAVSAYEAVCKDYFEFTLLVWDADFFYTSALFDSQFYRRRLMALDYTPIEEWHSMVQTRMCLPVGMTWRSRVGALGMTCVLAVEPYRPVEFYETRAVLVYDVVRHRFLMYVNLAGFGHDHRLNRRFDCQVYHLVRQKIEDGRFMLRCSDATPTVSFTPKVNYTVWVESTDLLVAEIEPNEDFLRYLMERDDEFRLYLK